MLGVARGRLGRQTIGTLLLRVGALVLALLMAVVLARLLGPEGFGAYSLAYAWIQILLVPGMLGMDSLIVREAARLQQVDPSQTRSYARWSTRSVLTTSLATALVGGTLVVALQASQGPEVVLAQIVALLLLPLMAVTRVWQACLRGVGRMFIGQLPEAMLIPVLVLAAAGIVWISSVDMTPALAIGLRIGGLVVAVALLGAVMWRALPAGSFHSLARAESRSLMRSSLALGLISATFLIVSRTDVVMLGVLSDLESVGNYTVANRGANFVVFPFLGLNVVLAPQIAALYASGDRRRLQRVLTWGSRAAFIAALPIALGLTLLGDIYLDLFGEGFAGGLSALQILTLGSLIASAAGSAGLVMIMTGHESTAAKVVGASAVLNVGLNLVLIPRFGAAGAALSTAVTTNLWTLFVVAWIRRRLRVDPTILGMQPSEHGRS